MSQAHAAQNFGSSIFFSTSGLQASMAKVSFEFIGKKSIVFKFSSIAGSLSPGRFTCVLGLYGIDFRILTLLLVIYKKSLLDWSLAKILALLAHIH